MAQRTGQQRPARAGATPFGRSVLWTAVAFTSSVGAFASGASWPWAIFAIAAMGLYRELGRHFRWRRVTRDFANTHPRDRGKKQCAEEGCPVWTDTKDGRCSRHRKDR